MEKGKCYAVGVGPGDPELLTLKAVRILERCAVIAIPRTRQGGTLAYNIASQSANIKDKELIHIDFAMKTSSEEREDHYARGVDAIVAQLDTGRDVAFLNLGDPSLYGTAGYILDRVAARGYETAVIPGINSFCDAAARLGVSLTRMEEPLHIIPAVHGDPEAMLRLPGTKVVMKASRGLGDLREAVDRAGLTEHTAVAERCGLPDERLYASIADAPDDTGYFTLLLIKE